MDRKFIFAAICSREKKKKKNSYSAAEEGTGTCTYMVKASIVKLLIDCGADVNMSSQG